MGNASSPTYPNVLPNSKFEIRNQKFERYAAQNALQTGASEIGTKYRFSRTMHFEFLISNFEFRLHA